MTHLRPFVLRFAISYLIIQTGVGLLATALDSIFGIKTPSMPITITALIITVAAVSHQFVKQYTRVFNQQERFYMAWTSLIASLLVSVLLIILLTIGFSFYDNFTLSSLLAELPNSSTFWLIMLASFIFVSLLVWGFLYWAYGYIPKQWLSSHSKKT
jgi:choline-glycine betaine transporter